MSGAIDLITKIVGVLAAVLGTAGYVLVLGGAILWLRLEDVHLPPEMPVSLASREELIAMGAQAVAVWVLLVAALGGLAAWIVTGDAGRRHFDYPEAGLSIAVTVATLLAIGHAPLWVLAPTVLAVLYVSAAVVYYWSSAERAAALLLPLAVGAALGTALALMDNRNGFAAAAGAVGIFAALVLLTPRLQRWRARMDANRAALEQLGIDGEQVEEDDEQQEAEDEADRLVIALKKGPGPQRSPIVVWIGWIAVGAAALLVLGVIAVGSQLDHDENFHQALVGLTNGDCIEGTYIVRGADQIVIGHPRLNDADRELARIAEIPLAQVLDVQVYGTLGQGVALARDERCTHNHTERLVRPAEPSKEE
jgi:hypothetical protein